MGNMRFRIETVLFILFLFCNISIIMPSVPLSNAAENDTTAVETHYYMEDSSVIDNLDKESDTAKISKKNFFRNLFFSGFDHPQMPGWPKLIGVDGWSPNGVTFADVNGDGFLEILVGSTDGSFHVWDYHGNELPGWPKLGLQSIACKPAVGDVDPCFPGLEIIVASEANTVYAWHNDGTDVLGWPRHTDRSIGVVRSPVLFDIDNDGYLEIILGQEHFPMGSVVIYRRDGTIYPGWPQTLDYACIATPSVADIDNDGIVEICAVSCRSIYLWDKDGNIEPGWPILNNHHGSDGTAFSQQVLADLDNDGDLEILVAYSKPSNGFLQNYVGVFYHDGRSFVGWPQKYPGPETRMCPVAGDVDEDGDLEIFNGGSLINIPDFTGRHHTGEQLEGLWPVIVGFVDCSPIITDIDNDRRQEIITGDQHIPDGNLFAFNSDGTIVEGWPITMDGPANTNSPTVGDVDGDGDTELGLITCYSPSGYATVNLWTFENTTYNISWISYRMENLFSR